MSNGELRRKCAQRITSPIRDVGHDAHESPGSVLDQYCRDRSQWARERSDSARSPNGNSA